MFSTGSYYVICYIGSFCLAVIFTYLTKKIAAKFNILDKPDQSRKKHSAPVALLGGVAIFFSYFLVLYLIKDKLFVGQLEPNHWFGVFVGGLILMIGGALDDKYKLLPKQQIVWPLLAIAAVLLGGVNIEKITNPAGGYIYLGFWSAIIITVWLLGMMYTTKLLDGVDGLVGSVVSIGSFIIFLFTITTKYYQPDIAIAALAFSACCAGFLIFNWHPAKIFLGEGGSLFLGFILGVLAIISGGKIAIALLIMGIPILDVAWTILRRIKARQNPFKFADRKHLHFRLMDMGMTTRQTVLFYCSLSALFGLSALFLQSLGKILALVILFLIMIAMIVFFSFLDKKSRKSN